MRKHPFTLVLLSIALLLFFSSSAYSATKQPYGTAAKLLTELKQKITSLKTDLETYRQQLIVSEQNLRDLQNRLETLQTESEALSRDLMTASESSENLSVLLAELRKSLALERLKARREKIIAAGIGVAAGVIITLAGFFIASLV